MHASDNRQSKEATTAQQASSQRPTTRSQTQAARPAAAEETEPSPGPASLPRGPLITPKRPFEVRQDLDLDLALFKWSQGARPAFDRAIDDAYLNERPLVLGGVTHELASPVYQAEERVYDRHQRDLLWALSIPEVSDDPHWNAVGELYWRYVLEADDDADRDALWEEILKHNQNRRPGEDPEPSAVVRWGRRQAESTIREADAEVGEFEYEYILDDSDDDGDDESDDCASLYKAWRDRTLRLPTVAASPEDDDDDDDGEDDDDVDMDDTGGYNPVDSDGDDDDDDDDPDYNPDDSDDAGDDEEEEEDDDDDDDDGTLGYYKHASVLRRRPSTPRRILRRRRLS